MDTAWQMSKTKILIYDSKLRLNVKILFSEITHILDPIKSKENVSDRFIWEWEFYVRFWSMIYVP